MSGRRVEALDGRESAAVKLELHGLEIFGRHGVLENEKRDGQMFLYDVELDVDEPAVGPTSTRRSTIA